MKKFDVISFDLDGTLAKSKAPLEPDMSELLVRLLAGYKVAVISGAALPQFEEQFISHLPQGEVLKNLYVLPTSGAALCNVWPEKSCVYAYTLSDEEKKEVREAFEKAFQETGYEKPTEDFGEIIEDRGQQMTFSALGQKAPLEKKLAWDPDRKKREALAESLKKHLPEFAIGIGGKTSIDVTRRGIDKASGLKMMMENLGVSRERVLYIGDELTPLGNDAPALTVGVETRPVKDPDETKKVISELLADLDG